MVNQPIINRLMPFTIAALGLHCTGYFKIRELLNYHMKTSLVIDVQYYANAFHIFTAVDIISLVLGSIAFEVCANKHMFTVIFTLIWILVLGTSSLIGIRPISLFSLVLIGIVSSTVKVAIISFGAIQYDFRYSRDLFVYFIFSYFAMVIGKIASLYYVPPIPAGQWTSCLEMSCISSRLLIAVTFSFISYLLIYHSKYSFVVANTLPPITLGSFSIVWQIVKMSAIILPSVWISIAQKPMLQQWAVLAELSSPQIGSYLFNRDYLEHIYVWCIFIFIVIFYIFFYKKCAKYLLFCPYIAIIGGCLIMCYGTIATIKFEENTRDSNATFCKENETTVILCNNRFPSYVRPRIYSNFDGIRDVSLPDNTCKIYRNVQLNGHERNGTVWYLPFTNQRQWRSVPTLLKEKKLYSLMYIVDLLGPKEGDFPIHDNYTRTCQYSSIERGCYWYTLEKDEYRGLQYVTNHETTKSGFPRICMASTLYYKTYITDIFIYMVNNFDQTHANGISYHFTFQWHQPTECHTIMPGMYKITLNLMPIPNIDHIFQFEMGMVYYLDTARAGGNTGIIENNVIDPYRQSNFWLIFPIIAMAVGETLIQVAGLYIVYTESHPNLKSISIGIWMFSTRAGDFYNQMFSGLVTLHKAAYIFKRVAIIYAAVAIFLKIFTFNKNWAPSANLMFVVEKPKDDDQP